MVINGDEWIHVPTIGINFVEQITKTDEYISFEHDLYPLFCYGWCLIGTYTNPWMVINGDEWVIYPLVNSHIIMPFMGKSPISMGHFQQQGVSLPEGTTCNLGLLNWWFWLFWTLWWEIHSLVAFFWGDVLLLKNVVLCWWGEDMFFGWYEIHIHSLMMRL